MLLFSINAYAIHLVRSILSTSPTFIKFCSDFVSIVSRSFSHMFHLSQISDKGKGLLKMVGQSDLAFFSSLIPLKAELTSRGCLQEENRYLRLIDQIFNGVIKLTGLIYLFWHFQSFLAI